MDALLEAAEAAEYLGVRVETLYAYVSRGLLDSLPGTGDGRRRRYRKSDLDRLKRRSGAHAGHAPAAAMALDWGAPSLDTELTNLTNSGPTYRGVPMAELVRDAVPFESVAELLWTGSLPDEEPHWFRAPTCSSPSALPVPPRPVDALRVAVLDAGLEDDERLGTADETELRIARRLLVRALSALTQQRADVVGPEDTVASGMARALGVEATDAVLRAIDAALVVVADHELNASAFTARVAASAGADLYACVGSALATFSGPKHGGACDRCAALLTEIVASGSPRSVLAARMQRGEPPPGFGHPLYPDGDPRFDLLEQIAGDVASGRLPPWLDDLKRAATRLGLGRPNSDMGLALLCRVLQASADGAVTLFAVGRMAGWIAHAREQRAQGFLLRPRARYVGR
ncbi:MAG: citrate synthase family protein [Gemmatimonadota bacterium]